MEKELELTPYQNSQFWRHEKEILPWLTGSGIVAGERGIIEIQAYQNLLQSRAKRSMNHTNAM